MKFMAKGQKPSATDNFVEPGTMLRSMVFGTAFAIGLTFSTSPGIAQSDGAGAAVEVPAQENMNDNAATTEKMAPSDASEPARVEVSGDATSSVVFMYHRFGEDEYPSTNIKIDQFKEHVAELTNGRDRKSVV